MEKVTLDGITYERSAAVAKRFGYTADYLGQLSRSGKVRAQLVGRSWYVDSTSVAAYKDSLDDATDTKPTTKDNKKGARKPSESDSYSVSIRKVAPADTSVSTNSTPAVPQKRHTSDVFKTRHIKPRNDEKISNISISRPNEVTSSLRKTPAVGNPLPAPHWKRIAYQDDPAELLPAVQKAPADSSTPDLTEAHPSESEQGAAPHHDSRKLRIHSNTEQYSIVSSGVPEVRLRGAVRLSATDDDESVDYTHKNHALRQQMSSLQSPPATKPASARVKKVVITDEQPLAVGEREKSLPAPEPVALKQRRSFKGWRLLVVVCVAAPLLYVLLALETSVSYSESAHASERSWHIKSPQALWIELF